MDRRPQLDEIRREIHENVLNMLENTSAVECAPCCVTLETPGMDEEFCTTIEEVYRENEDIWCNTDNGNIFDFDELDIYQMAQIEAELSDYYK